MYSQPGSRAARFGPIIPARGGIDAGLSARLPVVNALQPCMSPRPAEVGLRVSVGSLQLKNPITAASGTFGYGVEFAPLVDLSSLGAVVVKGLSIQPMEGAPAPRICE